MEGIVISKKDLKVLFQMVLSKIEDSIGNTLTIPNDYYLNFSMVEAYKISTNPAPSIGSLIDDWENLSKLLSGTQNTTYVDVDRFSALLKAINHELNPI